MSCYENNTSQFRSVGAQELDMIVRIPKKIAAVGGVLISISGVVNAALGERIGALLYGAYPGGRMGHLEIIAGVVAITIGLAIIFTVVPIYERSNRGLVVLGGTLTIVLGHLSGIAGAIYIGTVGVVLCYLAGI